MGRLARAALVGLTGGLFVAGLVLGVLAALRLQVDCAGLGVEACTFERTVASSVARLQALAALGCVLVAGGLAVGLRR